MDPNDLSVQRFSGFADVYDRYRPSPPAVIADVLCRLAQRLCPDLVVDLGCGTGLSTRYWSAKARQVIGIDPTPDMLQQARQMTSAPDVTYRQGYSHATGLPDQSAEVVTCSQALHWMEPEPTFQEVRRILKPGGVFAAWDYDWPPHTLSWQVAQAYEACMSRVRQAEKSQQVARQWPKSSHLQRMTDSGCFRYATEMVIHHNEDGNAERIVGVLLSQGSVAGLLKAGFSEHDLGIDYLRAVAQRELGDAPQTWYWSCRVRLGVV